MNGPRRHFVDTNIFIYALDAADTFKMDRATEVLGILVAGESGVVSAQVLGETYSNLVKTTKVAMPPDEANDAVEAIVDRFLVEVLTLSTVRDAMRIFARYQTTYYDSLLVAAARAHGASTLLTEDFQAEQVIEGVRVLHVLDDKFDLSRLD